MRCFRCLIALCVVSISLLGPDKTVAYSVVHPARSVLSQPADPLAVGQSLVNPQTPTLSWQELVDRGAGKPSPHKYAKYEGDLARYWQTASLQRAGKTFEAMVAYRDNHPVLWKRLLHTARGNKYQIVVTAAEGFPDHPADLLMLNKHGEIVQRYQAKLGWEKTVQALRDPKYAGQSILTPHDSFATIQKELLQAEQAARRLGVPLPDRWSVVKQAFEEGRLLRRTPAGSVLPTRDEVLTQAKQTLAQPWQARGAASETVRHSARGLRTLAQLGHVAGKALIVADVVGNVYFTYHDVQRFQAGEIGGGYLALKTGLRGVQVGLAFYAVVSPEPYSKSFAAVAVVVLVTADIATEWIHDVFSAAEQEAAWRLLESIDRDERYYVTRRYLLYAMNGLREPPTGSR